VDKFRPVRVAFFVTRPELPLPPAAVIPKNSVSSDAGEPEITCWHGGCLSRPCGFPSIPQAAGVPIRCHVGGIMTLLLSLIFFVNFYQRLERWEHAAR
jgi:hypothetical protein